MSLLKATKSSNVRAQFWTVVNTTLRAATATAEKHDF
jgi:hypothetical protein